MYGRYAGVPEEMLEPHLMFPHVPEETRTRVLKKLLGDMKKKCAPHHTAIGHVACPRTPPSPPPRADVSPYFPVLTRRPTSPC